MFSRSPETLYTSFDVTTVLLPCLHLQQLDLTFINLSFVSRINRFAMIILSVLYFTAVSIFIPVLCLEAPSLRGSSLSQVLGDIPSTFRQVRTVQIKKQGVVRYNAQITNSVKLGEMHKILEGNLSDAASTHSPKGGGRHDFHYHQHHHPDAQHPHPRPPPPPGYLPEEEVDECSKMVWATVVKETCCTVPSIWQWWRSFTNLHIETSTRPSIHKCFVFDVRCTYCLCFREQ